jgi:hypothetical protein
MFTQMKAMSAAYQGTHQLRLYRTVLMTEYSITAVIMEIQSVFERTVLKYPKCIRAVINIVPPYNILVVPTS